MGETTKLDVITSQPQHEQASSSNNKALINQNHADEERNLCWKKFSSPFQLCIDGIWHKKNKDDVVADDKPKMGKETLYEFKEILDIINKKNFDKKISGYGVSIFKGPFGVPENPEFTVGLDLQLIKLKMELLKDGRSTLVLTGMGGLGKTTLATKLCLDEQIKGKFKILFDSLIHDKYVLICSYIGICIAFCSYVYYKICVQ